MENSTIETARQMLMLQGRKIDRRARKRRKQMRLERRRLGQVMERLDELMELTFFGLVPGAQVNMPHLPQPYLQVVGVLPDTVIVRLADGGEYGMSAACLIKLATGKGVRIVPPPEETSNGLSG